MISPYLSDSQKVAWSGTFCTICAATVSFISANALLLSYPDITEPEKACIEGCRIIAICSLVSFVTAVLSIGVAVIAMLTNGRIKRHLEAQKDTTSRSKLDDIDFLMQSKIIKICSISAGVVWLFFSGWSLFLTDFLYQTHIIGLDYWYPLFTHVLNVIAANVSMGLMHYHTTSYAEAIIADDETIDQSTLPALQIPSVVVTDENGARLEEIEAVVEHPRPSHALWRLELRGQAQARSSSSSSN